MSYHDETTEYPREDVATDRSGRERRTGWHPVNTGHLVMGVALSGLVVVWALLTTDTVELRNSGWIMGLPWLIAGAVGLAASVLRGRRRDEPLGDQQGWDDQRMRGWQ